MSISKKNVLSVIDEEIAWCVKAKSENVSDDKKEHIRYEGFIDGLRQARNLIKQMLEDEK